MKEWHKEDDQDFIYNEIVTFKDGDVYVCVSLYPYCASNGETAEEAVGKIRDMVVDLMEEPDYEPLKDPWSVRVRYHLSHFLPWLGFPSGSFIWYYPPNNRLY